MPKSVVQAAISFRDQATASARRQNDDNLSFDSIWCVFDVDEHPEVDQAKQLAKLNGLKLAVSNPCFELWLLLHFRDNPGAQHHKKIQAMLKELVPDFDKEVNYERDYKGKTATAESRAIRMWNLAAETGIPEGNPTTGVFRLTREISRCD